MKFHDIPVGQRFELDGATYVKTSPMLASAVDGGASRFMPRYALVRLPDDAAAPARKTVERLLRVDDALAAFDVFYELCRGELVAAGDGLSGERQENLRLGREAFVAALERRARKP